jgi:formate hydrogenlyase transcriptional activator
VIDSDGSRAASKQNQFMALTFAGDRVLLSPGPQLRVPLTDIVVPLAESDDVQSSALEQVEREMIVRALQESNWVVGGVRGAAARLRLNRTGLVYKMKKFGISRPT